MAAPHAFVVTTIRDAKGKESITKTNFPDTVSFDVLKAYASTTATLLDAIVRGAIVAIGIGLEVALPSGIKTNPLATADVEEGARFQWRASSGAVAGWRIPTFDEDLLLTGTAEVDLADTDVDAYVQRVLAGHTVALVNVSPSDDRGSDIVSLESARESFVSSRN